MMRNEARYRPGARLTEEDAGEVIHLADALTSLLSLSAGKTALEE